MFVSDSEQAKHPSVAPTKMGIWHDQYIVELERWYCLIRYVRKKSRIFRQSFLIQWHNTESTCHQNNHYFLN